MSLSYQMKLPLEMPEEDAGDSALTPEEIQLRKEAARARVENPEIWPKDASGKSQKPYWYDQYQMLVLGQWPFRVAVLIAWLATPRKYRWPKTQDELANLLGLSSDRQFNVWMARNPQIKAMVHGHWKEVALDRLNDSIDAMLEVAAIPDYKGKRDREMHFKLAGILSDKVILDKSGAVDLSKLSFEEKLQLAGLENYEDILALKDELTQEDAEEESDEKDAEDAATGDA